MIKVTIYPVGFLLLATIGLAIFIGGYIWGYVRGKKQSEERYFSHFLNEKEGEDG